MAEDNPMHSKRTPAFLSAPRCGARTRQGTPCQAPAVKGKSRCRMHGGAKGSGAPKGNRNALKHGFYTRASEEERAKVRKDMKALQETLDQILDSTMENFSTTQPLQGVPYE